MAKEISSFERQLCDIQGRLFELSHKHGLASEDFICKFMNSETGAYFDLPYDRLQWAGEEYILDALMLETTIDKDTEKLYPREAMYWIGYVYRYWCLQEGETSAEVYAQADAALMNDCYLGFHTLDVRMAIEDLKEIARQHGEILADFVLAAEAELHDDRG